MTKQSDSLQASLPPTGGMRMNETHPPGSDWIPWMYQPPYLRHYKVLLELWRSEWGNETSFARCSQLSSDFNVAGLWWRPAE